ncbi:DDE-type integrase/transposase/recombinase [uncultured Desulfovibrio sp.]|uniref:DDE-type integrase/transposase/recombinase n=1 Tax=uncultured Desulfovibrio sp. TaxID=167968 RepID=UPI00338F19F7
MHGCPGAARPEEDCYGHWECDTVHGNRKSGYIVTAVERKSGFFMAGYSASRSSSDVAAAIEQMFSKVPAGFFKSITYDQGKELVTSRIFRTLSGSIG